MKLPTDDANHPVPVLPIASIFTLDGTLAHTESTALTVDAVVQLTAETACRFRVGINVIATEDGLSGLLPEGASREYFLPKGHVISAIGGKCNVIVLI